MLPANATTPDKEIAIDAANFAKLDEADQQRVLEIKERLEAIADLDRSSLTKEERKALRAEVNGLRDEAREFNRGGTVIYLSTGAIILILLLIILL